MTKEKRQFGLIGYPLEHSFSPGYFKEKFSKEGIDDAHYSLYPLEKIEDVVALMKKDLSGFNVTIPYKKAIMDYLDDLDDEAREVGAVNTVVLRDGKAKGYNSDVYGFETSLRSCFSKNKPKQALILGNGGATRAVKFVLDKLGIAYQIVSRQENFLNYQDLDDKIINAHHLIINTTPLGMSPHVDKCPDIPYAALTSDHILYDLIYNPEETLFLKRGKEQGANIKGGLEMLHLQAEKSWEFWNADVTEKVDTIPVDFSNTEIAFSNKSDKALLRSHKLFNMMNRPSLVNFGSTVGALAVKWNLPFTKTIVRNTIFQQFCGGETLLESQAAIDNLFEYNCVSILDYGVESKNSIEELESVLKEIYSALDFASKNKSVPVISLKLTSLVENEILEKLSSYKKLSATQETLYLGFKNKFDAICRKASELSVAIFVDAEESWMQEAVDKHTIEMMEKYNKARVIVYNTYQMYRHDRLEVLKADYASAAEQGYILGAKIVRGAYMEKERTRAEEMGYPSPIQVDKAATDRDYNAAIEFCIDHYEGIASCAATHNLDSCYLQARLIAERGIRKDHYHLNFCQLMGMSDYITFNLAKAGYNVAKYVVYGTVKDVVPYLIRRAKENTSILGEASRELKLIEQEIERRKLN